MVQINQNDVGHTRVVVMGCNALGATVSTLLAERGYVLHLLDVDSNSFRRISPGLIEDGHIITLVADGTEEDGLKKGSIQDAQMFMALSDNETKNGLAAQIAKQVFQVPISICRVDDPLKEEVYNEMGILCLSSVKLMTREVIRAITA